jgi:hypothetical protein
MGFIEHVKKFSVLCVLILLMSVRCIGAETEPIEDHLTPFEDKVSQR